MAHVYIHYYREDSDLYCVQINGIICCESFIFVFVRNKLWFIVALFHLLLRRIFGHLICKALMFGPIVLRCVNGLECRKEGLDFAYSGNAHGKNHNLKE